MNITEFLFGFTRRMYDIEDGLQNNLHRWYDADVGRWISEDPIGFAAGDANLFRYVGNGVTRWVDPSGLVQGNASHPYERHFDGSIGDESRNKMMKDANDAGVGDEAKEIVDKFEDSDWGPFMGYFTSFWEYWKPGDDNDRGFSGPCGETLEDVLEEIDDENLDESDAITIGPVVLDREKGIWTTHNALQVTISKPDGTSTTYYVDNGYLGGSDNVFTQKERNEWEGNGR